MSRYSSQEEYNRTGTQPSKHYSNVKSSSDVVQILHPIFGSMRMDKKTIKEKGWESYILKF